MKVTRDRFVAVVRETAAEKASELEDVRARASSAEGRDLWTSIIRSLATMQRSSGWELLRPAHAREPIAYDKLLPLPLAHRVRVIEAVFTAANVRMAAKKARWLAENVDLVAKAGGPAAYDIMLGGAGDREAVIDMLSELRGFGPKYARDLPMDRRHPLFLDAIAIDSRIDGIGAHVDLGGAESYEDKERFFLDVARDAGLADGWTLDRLLYNFGDLVLEKLGIARPRSRRRSKPSC